MAELIVGKALREVARRRPALRRPPWRVDLVFVRGLTGSYSLLPVASASRFGKRARRCAGPHLIRETRYRVSFYPPTRPNNPGVNPDEQTADMTQQRHTTFENGIGQHPEHGFSTGGLRERQHDQTAADPGNSNVDTKSHAA